MQPAEFQRWYSMLPEAMLLVAADGEVLAANNAASELLGRSPAGSNLYAFAADDPGKLRRYLTLCRRGRQFTVGALAVRVGSDVVSMRAEGALAVSGRPGVLLRLTPKEGTTGRFVELNSRIEALQREIVERQRVEAALHAQREWLRTTLASIGDAVIATNADGCVVLMNAIAEQLTGWTQADAYGVPLERVFQIVNEGTRETVESPVERVLREGGIVGLANHTLLIARDGTERPIDDSGAPIRDPDGRIAGVVLVFRDVSERRAADQALTSSNRSLTRTNESLRQFAYAAAHDLKEPLRTVSLYAQAVRRRYRGKLDSQADEFLEYIRDGASRMELLVHDLLAFTEAGDALERPASLVSLGEALEKALLNLHDAMEQTRAIVTHDDLPEVMAHEVTMVQMFQNLLANAIQYAKPDEPPRIHIAAERRQGSWLVSVRDNGIGIARKYHEYVFRIFRRLRRNDSSGTGIGLAICQRVVESYGGSIWVESDDGQGATFFFTLPAVAEARTAVCSDPRA